MQMVFQDPLSSLNPRLPVWRIITEPLWIAKRSSEQQRRALAEELAVQVGIRPEYLDRLPHAFSGEQRQRIAIARALSSQPDVIVLDEPTSALDISVQAQILNLLVTLQENHGLTYVLISHNVSVIRHMSDRVAGDVSRADCRTGRRAAGADGTCTSIHPIIAGFPPRH
ncbi:putative D,D-dipeptide transport ATP-binding protein ddpF [Escherichia coli]|uniref:Putative D,D-dipeptide transport ATP-binding protein ddpF n=1 Tax=Escherichia coli TaxID=562 RepID=A0A2X1KWQ8_ECOLX|nr:putative D,D-dipeptide transport ATP-binding protein ddpF [Escherichia coli]